MDFNRRYIQTAFFPALLALLLLLGGCSAPINPGASIEARYAVWVYLRDVKKDKEAPEKVDTLTRQLGDKYLEAVKIRPLLQNLPAIRQYLAVLTRPVVIKPHEALAKADMGQSLKSDILTWYGSRTIEINGMAASPAWQGETQSAQDLQQRLLTAKNAAAEDADRFAAAGRFEESDANYIKAITLDDEDRPLAANYVQMQHRWVAVRLENLSATMNATTFPALQNAMTGFHQPDKSSLHALTLLNKEIDSAREKLLNFMTWVVSREEFSNALASLRTQADTLFLSCAKLRGKAWQEHLWLLAEQGQFWDFYQQTRRYVEQKTDGNNIAYYESELGELKSNILAAYVENIPKAEAFYSLQASKSRTQRMDGLALIYWRIASELLDYGQQIGCHYTGEVMTMQSTLDASMKTVRARVRESFDRSIFIPLFESDNLDGRNVSRNLETLLRKTFEEKDSPSTFLGISVLRNTAGVDAKPSDYRLEGKIAGIYVDAVPPVESERREMQVGRDIASTLNTDSRTKDDYPYVFSQEVWVYERIMTKHSKKCTIRADFTVEHMSKKSPLWDINAVYGEDNPLPGSVLVDNAVEWKFVVIRKHESPRRTDMLDTQNLPKNQSAALTLDREIQQRASDLICENISLTIIPVVESYPFVHFKARPQDALPYSESIRSANASGLLLEYLCLLARAENAGASTIGNGWIAIREQMVKTLAEHIIPAWQSHNVTVPADVLQAWPTAVRQAHEVKLP